MLNPVALGRAAVEQVEVRTAEVAQDTQTVGRQPPRVVLAVEGSEAPVGTPAVAVVAAAGTAAEAEEQMMTRAAPMPVVAVGVRPTQIRNTPKILNTFQV